jgi:hypothetical protein
MGSDLRQDTSIRDSTTNRRTATSISIANTITHSVPERYHVHEHCGLLRNKRHMPGLQLPTKRTNRDNVLLPTAATITIPKSLT